MSAVGAEEAGLVRAWREAASRPEIEAELDAIERMVEDAIEARRPVCEASGRCCRFEAYGHRLYVTGLEAARFGARLVVARPGAPSVSGSEVERAVARGGCPFQVAGRCSVHGIRPVGCRVYFCDASAGAWVERAAGVAHDAVRRVHEAHGIPYRYGEWRAMLALVAR